MERLGLVASIEARLERMIGAGPLPRDGKLGSEQLMARQFGVSRTTIREALGRLAARGLLVQHPGRRARVVALDETVTLENLGVALHGVASLHSERQRLLEGYFALKREATVELLAACREHSSGWELERVMDACFLLWNAARWEENWVAWEFELLRRAARAAQRPGHLLLIHSLERAWRGIQARIGPHLDAEGVSEWAIHAFNVLAEKDSSALKRELLPLLRACDERVLARLAPVREGDGEPEAPCGAAAETPHVEAEPAREALSAAACPNRSACRTGSCDAAPEEASPSGPAFIDSCHPPEPSGPLPGAREEYVPASSLECSLPQVPPDSLPVERSPSTASYSASEAPLGGVGTPTLLEWPRGLPCPEDSARREPADDLSDAPP